MYFDERNNFVEKGVPAIPLVFKTIDIIGLIDLQHIFGDWAEKLTSDPNVAEGQDKAD